MAKISVIVPIYNVERHLEKGLDSLINQTLEDIEIILIDDCSADNSYEIAKKYALKDKRIKLFRHENNQGVSSARNKGIELSNGEYLAFLDSDDWLDYDFYEKLYFNKEDFDVVKGAVATYDISTNSYCELNLNEKIAQEKLYFCRQFWSAIYRAKFIKENKIFFPQNIRTFEDPIFSLEVLIKGASIKLVNDVKYYYFLRPDSKVRTYSKEKAESFLDGVEIAFKLLNQSTLSEAQYFFIYRNLILPSFQKRCLREEVLEADKKYFFKRFKEIVQKNSKYKNDVYELESISKFSKLIEKIRVMGIFQYLRSKIGV